jgi:TPR repeat protein
MANKYLAQNLLIAGLLFLSIDACAKELDDAVDAMRAGDFAEAYCIMRPLAEAGDADAQYNIGWMYLNGYGLRTNDILALQWWEKASAQGNSDASLSIGMLYSLGEGDVAKDLNKAIDYYLLAASDGQEDAITILQSMMQRNDREMRGRMHSIIAQHGSLFGEKYLVKANKLNARIEPSTESKVLARLVKGQAVLELQRQSSWSQVVVLDDETIDRTVWVYNPLLEKNSEVAGRAD